MVVVPGKKIMSKYVNENFPKKHKIIICEWVICFEVYILHNTHTQTNMCVSKHLI